MLTFVVCGVDFVCSACVVSRVWFVLCRLTFGVCRLLSVDSCCAVFEVRRSLLVVCWLLIVA